VITRYRISGAQLKRIFAHIMRPDNRNSEGECYQVNGRVKAVYNDTARELASLAVNRQPVSDDHFYTIAMLGFHSKNSSAYLNITNEELLASGKSKVISTSAQEVLEEYLRNHQNISRRVEGRLIYN
ncbi:MAG: 5'-nucleotidase C-terminal domain-containing protein, partial [Dehalococcoidales bacterium]|nr:5'-nucleotidase C-terminal domain-containing protein [Dehalococcoidales bacterium]